jgi:lysozyme
MILGNRGQELIKSYERLRLIAYLPTPNDVPTIGWGHTRGVRLGMTCTEEQAQQWFLEDVAQAVMAVSSIPVRLTPSMSDALVSLAFNAGAGAVSPTSTIGKALRLPDYFAAWAGFSLWRKQGGRDLLGLARRRAREMELFFEDGLPALDVGVIRA